jgi:putative SOS response-associated peptidase YedK
MCARVRLTTDYSELKIKFWANAHRPAPNLRPSYNIAPTQDLTVVRFAEGERILETMRWGLITAASKDAKLPYSTFNARAESVAVKATFRSAWRAGRRCLVVTNGFYEWDKRVGSKQPYAIARSQDDFTVMAGLWEEWTSPQGERIKTVTIVTCPANALIRPLHDRMPAILAEEDWPKWLGETQASEAELLALLKPYPAEKMALWPVDRRVNNWRNDGPDLIRPVMPGAKPEGRLL